MKDQSNMTPTKPCIAREKATVEMMIRFYCRHNEKNKSLCPSCQELLQYAIDRLEHCPFGEKKGTCRKCTIHCYKKDMRKKIQQVMRFSGPWMLFYAPLATLKHFYKNHFR